MNSTKPKTRKKTTPAPTELITSLADLARQIDAEHELAFRKARESLEHARTAGDLLIEVKDQLEHGEWTPWLEENCAVSSRQARRYIRLANNWDEISKTDAASVLSIDGALKLLAGPEDEPEADDDYGDTEPIITTTDELDPPDCLRDADGNFPTQTLKQWQAENAEPPERAELKVRFEYYTQAIRHATYDRWRAALAFRDIRDKRLFRDETETFDAWLLLKRWNPNQVDEFMADPIEACYPECVA